MALAAQGFADPRPGPGAAVTARHWKRVLGRMTVLQLDSVNVVCRSHYLPVLARLGPYDRAAFDRFLYRSGHAFEYVAHEASITAQDLHPLLRWRMGRHRWRVGQAADTEVSPYALAVLEEVAAAGPLSVKELADPGARTGPWWGRSKGKVALERLYVSGRLAIAERTPQFVTRYDLPERVIRPEVLAAPAPDEHDAHRALLLMAARSLGVGTAADLADYFRLPMPVARPLLAQLAAEGELELVEVTGWADPAYVHPEARRPRAVPARALLSPFDPVVWFRPRAERLFGFRYRIEIYVPDHQRVHGYYVLPFLLGDELVARVDLKADRRTGTLLVRGTYAEDGVDHPHVATELAQALTELATWLDLTAITVEPRGDLAPALASRL